LNEDYVEIDASVIGEKKPIKVLASQGAYRRAMTMLRDLAKAEVDRQDQKAPDDADEDALAVTMLNDLDTQLDLMDKMNQYVISTLKLNQKQMTALDSISMNAAADFARDVAGQVMGMESSQKATEDDQKSDAVSVSR
jgi:hypothetical protein